MRSDTSRKSDQQHQERNEYEKWKLALRVHSNHGGSTERFGISCCMHNLYIHERTRRKTRMVIRQCKSGLPRFMKQPKGLFSRFLSFQMLEFDSSDAAQILTQLMNISHKEGYVRTSKMRVNQEATKACASSRLPPQLERNMLLLSKLRYLR